MHFYPCKITVINKSYNAVLSDQYLKPPHTMKLCNVLEENQTFMVENPYIMPENMCASAWADIRPYIITMATGGKFDFMKDTNVTVAICSDPFRPVTFEIKRVIL